MDFYDSQFKDVLRYVLYPLLDPISRLVFSEALYFIDIKNIRLTFDQLITLSKYPKLIEYFSQHECDIKKGFLYPRSWGLGPCKWYPFYHKTNEYRKYTKEEYYEYNKNAYYYDCKCINCINPGYCKVSQLIPFLDGIVNKPITKQIRRTRTKYENILYACGMMCNSSIYNLNKPPFHKLMHDKISTYLLYFCVLSRNKPMILELYKQMTVRFIDHGLRWLPDKDFIWIVDNYENIFSIQSVQGSLYIIEWVLNILSRDRLSGYYK